MQIFCLELVKFWFLQANFDFFSSTLDFILHFMQKSWNLPVQSWCKFSKHWFVSKTTREVIFNLWQFVRRDLQLKKFPLKLPQLKHYADWKLQNINTTCYIKILKILAMITSTHTHTYTPFCPETSPWWVASRCCAYYTVVLWASASWLIPRRNGCSVRSIICWLVPTKDDRLCCCGNSDCFCSVFFVREWWKHLKLLIARKHEIFRFTNVAVIS